MPTENRTGAATSSARGWNTHVRPSANRTVTALWITANTLPSFPQYASMSGFQPPAAGASCFTWATSGDTRTRMPALSSELTGVKASGLKIQESPSMRTRTSPLAVSESTMPSLPRKAAMPSTQPPCPSANAFARARSRITRTFIPGANFTGAAAALPNNGAAATGAPSAANPVNPELPCAGGRPCRSRRSASMGANRNSLPPRLNRTASPREPDTPACTKPITERLITGSDSTLHTIRPFSVKWILLARMSHMQPTTSPFPYRASCRPSTPATLPSLPW
mmetsp:Transcript_28705/g.93254  ORF Transcript_28705/g.93254 Transcript_28705/m.93254 type:complete len:280 (-) Transcript_28705:2955-3794(-)